MHPGGIRTNIANAARMGKSENAVAQRKGFDKLAMTTPEKAAETIVKGILKNESRILGGPDAWVSTPSTVCWVRLISLWWNASPARTCMSDACG